ncbi:hypothetical protein C0J52_05943 [Blattella germanica]|nr:hypothetical protein C0J52_05943 [Blattella germanica]
MKNRLKTKIDLKKTGNIPIILKDWERDLLDMLQGETNPTIARIPGGRKCGFNTVAIDELSIEETEFESHGAALASSGEDVLDTPVSPGTTVDDTPGTSKKPSAISRNKKRALEEMEDEFTKELSFQELQRYFLLKQVKILKMQENEIAKHERLMQLEEEKSKKKEILLNLQIEKLLWEKEVRERQQGDSQYRLEAEDSPQFFHL